MPIWGFTIQAKLRITLFFNQSYIHSHMLSQGASFHAINWLHSTILGLRFCQIISGKECFVSDTDEATGEATCDVSGKSMPTIM